MALRIIRKSASQNQVELIKGTGDETPQISLLFFIEKADDLKRLNTFLEDNAWIQNKAQCLIMKSHAIEGSIRSFFTPLYHTIKLLNEPKSPTWSLRLRTFMQEAQADTCVFLPTLETDIDLSALCEHYLHHMHENPNTALLSPGVVDEDGTTLFAMGQAITPELPEYTLQIGAQTLVPDANPGLHYLYQGLTVNAYKALKLNHVFAVEAAPLPLCGLNRKAYLSLPWKNQEWDLPWLAQEMAQIYQSLQYRMGVAPILIKSSENLREALCLTDRPEGFPDGSNPESGQLFKLYASHGFTQKGTHFVYHQSKDARIDLYIEQKG
jgi:hypothetical protein